MTKFVEFSITINLEARNFHMLNLIFLLKNKIKCRFVIYTQKLLYNEAMEISFLFLNIVKKTTYVVFKGKCEFTQKYN